MATSKDTTTTVEWPEDPYDVEIVTVIGKVHVDPYQEGTGDTVAEAAFRMIAAYDKDGEYIFTLRGGRTYTVNVEIQPGPGDYK